MTDFPVQQLVPTARERIERATQRTAFFDGITIEVIQKTPVAGVEAPGEQYTGVQAALNEAFGAITLIKSLPRSIGGHTMKSTNRER